MTLSFIDIIAPFQNSPFVTDDSGETLTYGEAADLGARLTRDFDKGRALVFLLCDNSNATVSAYLHLLTSNHALLLLDVAMEQSLLNHLVEIYQPDYILRPDHDTAPVEALNQSNQTMLHDDLSILLSTSGSTGSPKLARFTQNNILANADSIAQYLRIDEDERPFCHLPLHYSFGFSIVNSHLIKGAHLQLTKSSIMERGFWDIFRNSNATSFSGVPFHFEMLKRLRYERQELPTLRYLSQAGGKLAPELVAEFAKLTKSQGQEFYVMYGQTEAAPRISYLPPELVATHPASIGKAIPGVELLLIDENGEEITKENVVGELLCISPAIMMGYANNADDLAFGDVLSGRLKTGDLAMQNSDGLFEITGRNNRFLKLQGNRVNLDEVENFLKRTNIAVACVGVDNMMYVVVEGDYDLDEIRAQMINSLKFPPRCLTMAQTKELPRNAAGKINYGALLKQATEGKRV